MGQEQKIQYSEIQNTNEEQNVVFAASLCSNFRQYGSVTYITDRSESRSKRTNYKCM